MVARLRNKTHDTGTSRALDNAQVAAALEEVADLLFTSAADSFRIAAYRTAASVVGSLDRPLADLLAETGRQGLEDLPHIGKSLSRSLEELIQTGRLALLDQLRSAARRRDAFTDLPGIGDALARRLREELGVTSAEDLFAAAYDGRLRRLPGMGAKRIQNIRECLSLRLHRDRPEPRPAASANAPSVAELLEIDEEYRRQAANGRLLAVAPRRYNPTGAAWLPILRTSRGGRQYRALYSNTARAHALEHVADWVVIYRDDDEPGQWTVITSLFGALRGRRIVRGREAECAEHYRRAHQMSLPLD